MKVNPVQVARKVLPPILLDGYRWMERKRDVARYQRRRIPWSRPYNGYRIEFLKNVLADDAVLTNFRLGESLPVGFGVGVDERCIEYPWLLSQIEKNPAVLLDAGSALNHDFILDHPILKNKNLHVLTLAPEGACYWQRGISYLYHDLRNTPIQSGTYDCIACVSTLEHIGFDNSLYSTGGDYREHRSEDFIQAVQELRRLLKEGGSLFITVPFGAYRDFGSFQQFDINLVERAVKAFGKAREAGKMFYRYTSNGWDVAEAEDCGNCEYVEWVTRLNESRPRPLPVEADLAAAARAVACLKMVKG